MKKKILAMCLVVALLATAVVGATLAYFTDKAEVKNTFTVGNIDIDLNETDVDGDQNTKANAYHLFPGQTYKKDPTVTVVKGSEACYVRLIVTVADYDDLKVAFPKADYWMNGQVGGVFLLEKLVDWDKNVDWICKKAEGGVYEFWYKEAVAKDADNNTVLPELFTEIKMPAEMTNEEIGALDKFAVTIVAHAIQTETFTSPEEAWAAFGA